jgi:hypothetical protein
MSVSVLSVSAIFVSLGTLWLVFGLDRRSRAIAEERFSDLSRRTMLLHNNHSARVLCAVICWLYPKARPGIDFVIDCEARDRWPRIREWRLKTPRPSEDDIKRAMSAFQEALRDEMTQGKTGRGIGAAADAPSST